MHRTGSTGLLKSAGAAQSPPVVAKRGRPLGATSWWRNLEGITAHHANVLLELWLAEAPVFEVRVLLSSLAGSRQHQDVITECWGARNDERRYTVPPKIKRKLCSLAVAHVVELRRDDILRQRAQEAKRALRKQGWTDMQIEEILSRTGSEPTDLVEPGVNRVLKIVNRRAPPATLRRKAPDRILRK
jgi:hypothetical protein